MAKARGKRARVEQEEEEEETMPIFTLDGEFSHIKFTSIEARERFLSLEHRLKPTRFLCTTTMSQLHLMDDLNVLLKATGCSGLATINAKTYKELTLEFMSSFAYNEARDNVSYRLKNTTCSMSLARFGKKIGASSTGEHRPAKANVGHDEMWKELTGKERAKGAKFTAHSIQHLVIRLWCKLVGHTYFARDEANNLTRLELDILYGAIGPKAIKYNVAHYVASMLTS